MKDAVVESVLERGIKDVIREHPDLGELLATHDVGCAGCEMGSCRVRDVMVVHPLADGERTVILGRIGAELCPGHAITADMLPLRNSPAAVGRPYSPPVAMLVDEHRLIKRVLRLLPTLRRRLLQNDWRGWGHAGELLVFVRSFSDAHHHMKEEDVLFSYVDSRADVVQVMKDEHEIGRRYIRRFAEAIEKRDSFSAAEAIESYRVWLTAHIKKEDDIVFPWIDRQLTDRRVGMIFATFRDVNDRSGDLDVRMSMWVEAFERDMRG